MLPVAAGRIETKRQILIYSILLLPVSAMPWISVSREPFMAWRRLFAPDNDFARVRLRRTRAETKRTLLVTIRIFYSLLFILFAALWADATVISGDGNLS